jgi:hypothetical protein
VAPRYVVSGPAVHLWLHRHLLPPAVVTRTGFGRTETRLADGAHDQLLALCRYRFDWDVSRLDWIGALLWLDGFDIPFDDVRSVFVQEAKRLVSLRQARSSRNLDEADRARLASSAERFTLAVHVPGLSRRLRAGLAVYLTDTLLEGAGLPKEDALAIGIATAQHWAPADVEALFAKLAQAPSMSWTDVATAEPDMYALARRVFARFEPQVPPTKSGKGRVRAHHRLTWFLVTLWFMTAVEEGSAGA